MDTMMLVAVIAAGVAVLLAIALVVMLVARSRDRRHLKSEFGSEYKRATDAAPRRSAEAQLKEREQRVEQYDLRDLNSDEAKEFGLRWRTVQAEFVDRPGDAVEHADALLAEVMVARGYESTTPRERTEDISVGHGDEAEEYRLARASALRNRNGAASTEELRQAMIHFDRVFSAMLQGAPAR